jgi:hypothetical protein
MHEEADDGEGSDGRQPEEDPAQPGENRTQSEANNRESETHSGNVEETIEASNIAVLHSGRMAGFVTRCDGVLRHAAI